MPGVPGRGGPPPKRSTQRRRRNKPETPITEAPGAAEVGIPPADEDWHPKAQRWYESLAASGQSAFYEPSDWATAQVIADIYSQYLRPRPVGVHPETGEILYAVRPPNGSELGALLRGMSTLLTTEGERRRVRMELQRPKPGEATPADDPAVVSLEEFRQRLAG